MRWLTEVAGRGLGGAPRRSDDANTLDSALGTLDRDRLYRGKLTRLTDRALDGEGTGEESACVALRDVDVAIRDPDTDLDRRGLGGPQRSGS